MNSADFDNMIQIWSFRALFEVAKFRSKCSEISLQNEDDISQFSGSV